MEKCEFCEKLVDTKKLGVYRKVTGWSQVRATGGSNSLALTEPAIAWAHAACIQTEKLKKSGNYVQTETLF